MRSPRAWWMDFRLAMLRGRAQHLSLLALDYDAQARHCRADVTRIEGEIIRIECRRMLATSARLR